VSTVSRQPETEQVTLSNKRGQVAWWMSETDLWGVDKTSTPGGRALPELIVIAAVCGQFVVEPADPR